MSERLMAAAVLGWRVGSRAGFNWWVRFYEMTGQMKPESEVDTL